MEPRTQFAPHGDMSLAYQVHGEGPFDLVFVPGGISHVDLTWQDRRYRHFIERLATFARVIVFDKQGMGASDPQPTVATLQDRMDDIKAVMAAAGCERAAIFGLSEGGSSAALFAASHPNRARALILCGTFPSGDQVEDNDPDYPLADIARFWKLVPRWTDNFGSGSTLEIFAPSLASNPRMREAFGAFERAATTPKLFRAMTESAREMDIRSILPDIGVPTLVLHRHDDPLPVAGGRYIASRIPGARFVELAGDEHFPWWGDADTLLDEVEEFLTGVRPVQSQRMLATVLFTDIVGSTELAAELGDRRWSALLEDHNEMIQREVERQGGRRVNSTGDGVLATFDGPARAIDCALGAIAGAHGLRLELRAGLHAGECERIGEDIGGLAVNMGARIVALAQAGEVVVSSTVKELVVGSGIRFAERGVQALKGVPGEWRLFTVIGHETAPTA